MATDVSGIVQVGDGRGFIIEGERERLIVTAAHCLPRFPPCHGMSHTEERTYRDLIGVLGVQRNVWAECVFADPIADLAVLGSPDGQVLFDQAETYAELTDEATPFKVASLPLTRSEIALPGGGFFGGAVLASREWKGSGRLLSLGNRWFPCKLIAFAASLMVEDAFDGIQGGMSGSPIVAEDGAAVGVVCLSGGSSLEEVHTEGGPNPILSRCLPGWLLEELGLMESR